AVLRHAAAKHGLHALRWLDRDDASRPERQRQRVAPAAGPDVEPRLTRPRQRAEHLERRLVRPAGIRAEHGRDGRVEVAGRISLAEALGLLAIGADPVAPGAQRVLWRRPQHVGHARECAARGAIPQRCVARPGGCSRPQLDAARTPPDGGPASVRCSRPATLTARAFRSILDVEHALTTPRIAKEMTAMAPLEARDSGLHALIAPDAPIERVAGGLWFTEGPVWRDGALLFSDIPNKRIARWRRLSEGP